MIDLTQAQVAAAVIAGVVAMITAVLAALATTAVAERKLRRDYRLEYAAESLARRLMKDRKRRIWSFGVIKFHLGGFDDDELRRILVRAGCVRLSPQKQIILKISVDGETIYQADPPPPIENDYSSEFWGLLERNRGRFRRESHDVQGMLDPLGFGPR